MDQAVERFRPAMTHTSISAASLDTIETNPAWVDGVRKWVKTFLRPRTYKAPGDAKDHVIHLKWELEKLYQYLFYKVGLFPMGPEGDGLSTEELRRKVQAEMDAADLVLDEGLRRVNWHLDLVTPGTWDYEHDTYIREDLKARGNGDWVGPLVKVLQDEVGEVLKKMDAILSGKMLRAFNNWTKAMGGESHSRSELPLEVTIGKLKMVFDGKSHPNGQVWSGNEEANPANMADYVKYLEKTQTLLAQKGLGAVWYGPLFVSCKSCGGINSLGAKFGVGAHYVPSRDVIYLYSDPSSSIPYLLAHELGHRYYYKFMSAGDRARFDSYFKEVQSVTEYGGTDSGEDFAEVFAHYVTGKNMTRDQIDRFKAFLARKDRARLASGSRVACIIAAGVWDGKRSLLKNRDRNYTPKIKLVRDLINDIEVLYMEDEVTGWCEGLNEYGLGVVNSALAVGRDEKEKKFVETMGKKPKDGERILAALGCKTLDQALEKIKKHKGGLDGHTFVSTTDEIVALEQTIEHECKVTRLKGDNLHVRTNHGITYEDAGYTEGDDRASSLARRDQAMKVLRESDGPEDLALDLMRNRKDDRKHPNNMVRDAELYTTSQMILNLTSLELLLYVIRGKNEYQGLEDRLPKGRKPRIKVQVFEYVDNGDSVVELDPETGKEMKTKTANTMDPNRVATRFQAERVASRFLAANTPSPNRVAARFLEAAGPLPTWTVQDPNNRDDRGRATRAAFESYVGADIPKAQKNLKAIAAYLKKHPLFEGYKVEVKDKGVTGGEYGYVTWEAVLYLDNREAISMDIQGQALPKTRGEWATGRYNNPFELQAPSYHFIVLPRNNHHRDLSSPTLPTAAGCKKFLDQYVVHLLDGVGGPKKGRHTDVVTPEVVKRFVASQRSWFDLDGGGDGDDPRHLHYSTRDHGIRTDEYDKAGPEDIAEAKRLVAALRAEFGQAMHATYDTVDEWTSISIEIKK